MALLQLRFEYDSSAIRTRFEHDTTSYEEPTRSYALSSNNEHVNSFAFAVRCCSQSARRRRRFCDDVIVACNFSVYFSARFRRFVAIYTVFTMNDPIKNLSGQENLIELYRLARCFVRGTAQMLTIYADLRQLDCPTAYCYRAGSRHNI